MNNYIFIPLSAFLFNSFVWIYVFAQHKRSSVNYAFLIYAANLSFWIVYVLIMRLPLQEELIMPVIKFGSIAWLSVSFWFTNFTYSFLGKKRDLAFYIILVVTVLSIFVSLSTNLLFTGYRYAYWGIDEVPGLLFFPIISVVITVPASYSLILIARALLKSTDTQKKLSLRLILTGSFIALTIGVFSNVIIPHMTVWGDYVHIAESGTVIQSLFFFRAVIKYKLFSPGVEEAAHDIFANLHDLVIIMNSQGNILEMNKSAELFFHSASAELKGRHISFLIEDYNYLSDAENIEMEINVDGFEKILSITTSVISNQKLELGRILIAKDITERKKVENELTISHEQLRALSSRLAQAREKERIHIAREIHDELGQVLTAVKMDVVLLSESVSENTEPEKNRILKELKEIENMMDRLIQTVRNIATELRSDVLEHLGIAAAIQWQLHEFEKRSGINSVFNNNAGYINMNHERALSVFRIFQEALTNIIRHSEATLVEVSIGCKTNSLYLTVKDNGKGITRNQINDIKSIGITGMKERSMMAGGKFNIYGEKDYGTTVTLEMPLDGNN